MQCLTLVVFAKVVTIINCIYLWLFEKWWACGNVRDSIKYSLENQIEGYYLANIAMAISLQNTEWLSSNAEKNIRELAKSIFNKKVTKKTFPSDAADVNQQLVGNTENPFTYINNTQDRVLIYNIWIQISKL